MTYRIEDLSHSSNSLSIRLLGHMVQYWGMGLTYTLDLQLPCFYVTCAVFNIFFATTRRVVNVLNLMTWQNFDASRVMLLARNTLSAFFQSPHVGLRCCLCGLNSNPRLFGNQGACHLKRSINISAYMHLYTHKLVQCISDVSQNQLNLRNGVSVCAHIVFVCGTPAGCESATHNM